jgi:peptide/nickel transport system permease protein
LKFKIKNRYFILFALILIIAFRFSGLIEITVLFYSFVRSLLIDLPGTLSTVDFSLADNFLSLVLIIISAAYLILRRKSGGLLHKELSFTSSVIFVLFIFFIFAPVISTSDPDFQSNIGTSKLLPPFSSVKLIYPIADTGNENFGNLKNETLNENLVYIDSLNNQNGKFYCYQNGNELPVGEEKYLYSDNQPLVNSRVFILGTDEFGRDVFSRLVYGTRISMMVGLGAIIVAFILGIGLGFLSGHSGWISDTLLNRFTDMFLSFPLIFFIILILAFFGNSVFTIILVLGFSGWMSLFKIVRSEVIAVRQKDYFITAAMIGLSGWKLLTREIIPVIIAPVIVNLVFLYGNVILAEAALSYLGLGTGLNYPSWGAMIEAGQEYLSQAWWMIFFPGLALVLTLFAANNLGRILTLYYNPRIIE